MNTLGARGAGASACLIACFSHLRWDFVFQRPQHLLSRAAREADVLYIEEPVRQPVAQPRLDLRRHASGVEIATPVLPEALDDTAAAIRSLLDARLADGQHETLVTWYYTPMALAFSDHLEPDVCVYDCMDELSAFKDPPPGLAAYEDALFDRADLVFAGGQSLYDAKRSRHSSVYAFPSSIDVAHFAAARSTMADPADQAEIPHPRIGFFGVIDERMDLDLVALAAGACPEIQFVMIGPVVKIDPAGLPQAPNLHWLGGKSYDDLPAYLGNWDAGWMPFAINASTRFISPTKTPEFLAAGLPVTATAIVDVVRTYGAAKLVTIADADAIAWALRSSLAPAPGWLDRVNRHLAGGSWDRTWAAMAQHMRRIRSLRVPLAQTGA